jgi:hypothetical protein
VTPVRAHGGTLVRYALLILTALVFVVPLYWVFSASLKDIREIYTFPPVWIPTEPQFSNYSEAWNSAPFGRFYLNTIITTFFGVALEVVNAVLTAYALVFLRFPGRNIIFIVLLAALMVPIHVTILPNYLTIASLGWVNTYQGIILPGASVAFPAPTALSYSSARDPGGCSAGRCGSSADSVVRDPADLAAHARHRNPSLGGDEVERLPLAPDLNELDEHAYPADRPLISLQSGRC